MTRKVTLREEKSGPDWRNLWAYLDDGGALHIDGQDLGPSTAIVSADGEYEWFTTYRAADVARVVELLGGRPDQNVLEVLERWSGARSYELERILRESDIPASRHVI